MKQRTLYQISKCTRCSGTGWHTHGVCYGCSGLGIPLTNDYIPYKRNVETLAAELGRADKILNAMLNVMTPEQKMEVAAQLEGPELALNIDRTDERRTILALFGA